MLLTMAASDKLRLVFCGTPQFAVPTLERLHKEFDVALVVTQPDKPRGRGMEVTSSPVKAAAARLGLPLSQPEKIKNNAEFRAELESMRPDAIVVVGYGKLIPKWMLELPRLGNINLHASLLPKFRGAAPIQWAIATGESVTGNTTMLLNEGLDTGDILLQQELAIADDDTSLTLAPRLAAAGAELMSRTLNGLREGSVKPQPQDDARATLAPILRKEDGRIDFARSAKEISDRLRGFQPWPGAYTTWRGASVKFVSAMPAGVSDASLPPGETRVEKGRVLIGCGGGSLLEVAELQLEGKKKMSALDFINGMRPQSGERFGG